MYLEQRDGRPVYKLQDESSVLWYYTELEYWVISQSLGSTSYKVYAESAAADVSGIGSVWKELCNEDWVNSSGLSISMHLADGHTCTDASCQAILHGSQISVACNAGYYVKPAAYAGVHPVCNHDMHFDLACDSATCLFLNNTPFPGGRKCQRGGCFGFSRYPTVDGLQNLTFEREAGIFHTEEAGQLMHTESIVIRCPAGYRVQATSPAQASSPRFAHAVCMSDCSIARVQCRRITCGNFTVPANSVAARSDAVHDISAGTEVGELLYGETLTVSCVGNHRLGAAGMNCSQRGFRVRCGDEGQLEYDDDGLASSSLPAADQTCVPITCQVWLHVWWREHVCIPDETEIGEMTLKSLRPDVTFCGHDCNDNQKLQPYNMRVLVHVCVCLCMHTCCDGFQVSALNVSNAVVSPVQGKVMADDNITVACNPGYRIKPPGYRVALLSSMHMM